MTRQVETRSLLIESIRQAMCGHEPQDARLAEMTRNWPGLSMPERGALLQLQNWTKDRALRSQFSQHAHYSERRLAQLLDKLEHY
ncbi:hypothetical protein [Altererythrobacter aquiaggeris]|uniref:hypothetical protein n=1 Tax=Aestuarierythrobacter aquiaggeris TaxID=1898396 RepID=UPI0030162170